MARSIRYRSSTAKTLAALVGALGVLPGAVSITSANGSTKVDAVKVVAEAN